MNFNEFLLRNPEIRNNIKAVIKNKVLLNKTENIFKKEELNKKIDVNLEIIKEHINNMRLDKETADELQKNIDNMVEYLSENYDQSTNFKQNYSKAIKQIKENSEIDNNEEQVIQENSEEVSNLGNIQENQGGDSNKPEDEVVEQKETEQENEVDDSEEEQEENKKVKIVVNEKGYNIGGIEEPKEINPNLLNKKIRKQIEKNFYQEDYDEIMENLKNKNVRRNYDPNLLKILYNRFDKDVAIKYLQELSKGKKGEKDVFPYEITYDIKSIRKNKQIKTKKQLRNMIKIVRKNKHLAKVIDGRGKAARIGAVALLASAVTGLATTSITNRDSKESDKAIDSQKSYTDTVTPTTNTTESKTTETTIKDQNDKNIQVNQIAQKEQKDSFQDSLKVETNTDFAQKKIDELLEKLEEFNLGDQVELDEGVNYTEDSLGGGNTGTVGKRQWRPSGNYIVNGVSIINPQTNEIVTYSFGNDENGNKNPEFNLNKYLVENVKKGMEVRFHIDKDGTKPTGWIDSSNIIKSLEKDQEQQQDMNIDVRM